MRAPQRPRRQRQESGAAAVEFALVALLLLGLLLGIIQFSIYFWAYQVGGHAAREGGREYAVDPCNAAGTENVALVQSRVGGAAAGAVTVAHTFSDTNPPETGDSVEVSVTYSAPNISGGLFPSLPAITKTATARVEDVGDCP